MGRKWWQGLIGSKKSETSEGTAEERIQQAAETHAEALDLSNTGLPELPESLGHLAALQTLELSGNQLSALPESLGQLTSLQGLLLIRNQLTVLPESLGQLTDLRQLNLSDNRLTVLPASLGQLTALEMLDLSSNRLSTLPEWFGRLDELRKLYLHDNPHLGLPAEVLGTTWHEVHTKQKPQASPKSILDYYFRSRQARPLNEAKSGRVGTAHRLWPCLAH